MKGMVGNILMLLLTVVLVWTWGYLSTHDTVDEVVDVSTIVLGKGRVVHLIGVAPSAVLEEVDPPEHTEAVGHAPTLRVEPVILSVDTAAVEAIRERIEGEKVILEFTQQLQPDTSSQDLHAYLKLEDGTDVNAWILSEGLARVNTAQTHPREVNYASFQAEAKLKRRGIWAEMPADTTQAEEPAKMEAAAAD
jgi:hypothetical protein